MKDNIEELLKKALHEGEIPTAALNQRKICLSGMY